MRKTRKTRRRSVLPFSELDLSATRTHPCPQMTEEQKSEEGKRMFSIFAARMFEQRVLQAYREKVAQERQLQLLREIEDEDKLTKEREAKKQTANQRKKDKRKCVDYLCSMWLFR